MKKKWIRISLIVVSVGIIVGVLALLWVFRKSPDSVGSGKPDVEVDAATLISAFENDETTANQLYLNKILSIKGTIISVKDNGKEVTITLSADDAVSGIICTFAKSNVNMKKLKPGTEITVKGICNGYLMDAVLSKCVLDE